MPCKKIIGMPKGTQGFQKGHTVPKDWREKYRQAQKFKGKKGNIFNCFWCDKKFTRFQSKSTRSKIKHNFCSWKCYIKYRNRNENIIEIIECNYCGKKIKKRFPKQMYCNEKCYGKSRRGKIPEKLKEWCFKSKPKTEEQKEKMRKPIGELKPSSIGYSKISSRLKKLNHPIDCFVCHKIKKRMSIHHTDEDRSNNKLENLTCYCRRHHMMYHLLRRDGYSKQESIKLNRLFYQTELNYLTSTP